MKIIGITGPTGAGKTTALKALERLGARILDADEVYYACLAEEERLKKQLRERFGSGILNESGQVERKRLGEVVFGDSAALRDLNAIAHPYVLTRLDAEIQEARKAGAPAAVIDAIALIESGVGEKCDDIVCVLAPAEMRILRVMARDGVSEEYARRRVAAQQPDGFYLKHGDFILENIDGPEEFSRRAEALFRQILNLKGGN